MTSASKLPMQSTAAADAAAEAVQAHIQINLRKIPLLAGLSEDEMRRVNTEIRIRHFGKREVVLHKGGSCRWSTSRKTAARSDCACWRRATSSARSR